MESDQDSASPQAAAREKEDLARDTSPAEEPMLYCPVCNQKLASMRCKLICQRCGYYMSCADYY